MSGYAAERIASDFEPVGESGAKAKSIYDRRIKPHLFSKHVQQTDYPVHSGAHSLTVYVSVHKICTQMFSQDALFY